MKATRPGVSGDQHPVTTFAGAIQGAAGVFATARRERDELAHTHGVDAVAAAAAPGEENDVAALYAGFCKQAAAGHLPAA